MLFQRTRSPEFQRVDLESVAGKAREPAERQAVTNNATGTPKVWFDVVQIVVSSWEPTKAAAFDIIVVPRADATESVTFFTQNLADAKNDARHIERTSVALLARPSGTVVFFADCAAKSSSELDSWPLYSFARDTAGAQGRDVRGVTDATDMWTCILDFVVAKFSPSSAASSSASAAAAAVSTTPAVPRPWRTTPSMFVLHRNGNRGRHMTCTCLEGIITPGMQFAPLAFPSRGLIVEVSRPRDGAAGVTAAQQRERAANERFCYVPGDIFLAEVVQAPDFVIPRGGCERTEPSDTALLKNLGEGSVLRALPWSRQRSRDKIWACVSDALPGVAAAVREAAGVDHENTAAAAAAAATSSSSPTMPAVAAPPTSLFCFPSTVTQLVHLRLQFTMPTLEGHHAFASNFLGVSDLIVNVMTGACCAKSLPGTLVQNARAEATQVAPIVFDAFGDVDSTRRPGIVFFAGGSGAELAGGRLVCASTGRPFLVACLLTAPGTGKRVRVPVIAEVVAMSAAEDYYPDEYYGAGGYESVVLPTQLPPWTPEAAAQRQQRARLLTAQIAVSAPTLRKAQDDSQPVIFALLARGQFPRDWHLERLGQRHPVAAPRIGSCLAGAESPEAARAAAADASLSAAPTTTTTAPTTTTTTAEATDAPIMPSLLEWVLGVWLPPYPSRAIQGSKIRVLPQLVAASRMLRQDADDRARQSKSKCERERDGHVGDDGDDDAVGYLLNLALTTTVRGVFTRQVTGMNGSAQTQVPIALADVGLFAIVRSREVPIEFFDALMGCSLANTLVRIATRAATIGNVDLVVGITTGLLRLTCDLQTNGGATSGDCEARALFPARTTDFAPPRRFFPVRTDKHVDRPQRTKHRSPKTTATTCDTLDDVLVAVCANFDLVRRPDFASLVARVAFAQLRIHLQTHKCAAATLHWATSVNGQLRSMAAAAYLPSARSCSFLALPQSPGMTAAALAAEAPHVRRNVALVGCVYHYNHITIGYRRGRSGDFDIPVSVAVAVWFLQQALRPQYDRRASLGDGTAVTWRVLGFLIDME